MSMIEDLTEVVREQTKVSSESAHMAERFVATHHAEIQRNAEDSARYRWLLTQHNARVLGWHVRDGDNEIPAELNGELTEAMQSANGGEVKP